MRPVEREAVPGSPPWPANLRSTVCRPPDGRGVRLGAIVGHSKLEAMILRFKEALLGQVQQTAACNALHPLEARLARWLLQTLDRADGAELPLTQDFMAQMLAVRRTTVTLIAGKLQYAGLSAIVAV